MPRVSCYIEAIELDGVYRGVPSVRAYCPICDLATESYGRSEASIKRCLVKLREHCRRDENNFYCQYHPPKPVNRVFRGAEAAV